MEDDQVIARFHTHLSTAPRSDDGSSEDPNANEETKSYFTAEHGRILR